MRGWIYGAVAAVVTMAAFPAMALDTGQCLPAAEVRSALAAEGQKTIIIGNRSGYGYPTTLAFTSNADGSRGYAIRGDKPLGEQAGTICIDSVYRDVRLNDITRPGIPAWALMGNDPAKAEVICKRDKLGYQEMCAISDVVLRNQESAGDRVIFGAVGTAINPRDKSVREGQRILVTLNPHNQTGAVDAVTPEGASYMLSAYARGAYTQAAEAMMR